MDATLRHNCGAAGLRATPAELCLLNCVYNVTVMELRASSTTAPGWCEQRLSDCGIRPTAQRVRIATLLLSVPQHLSAEQILASLRTAGARVSKATVYNTLNLFAAHGLIRQLSVDGSRAWFDSNVAAHYHFHDLDSGALIDVPVPAVEFSRLPSPPPGTEVAGIDLVIRLRRKM
jgi:Fur family transcriptional regulator, iron response regulator